MYHTTIKTVFCFIGLFIITNISAQIDTLNYLKQFEANKVNYIGKPFSVLLNDINLF